jgi:hypothetical protein
MALAWRKNRMRVMHRAILLLSIAHAIVDTVNMSNALNIPSRCILRIFLLAACASCCLERNLIVASVVVVAMTLFQLGTSWTDCQQSGEMIVVRAQFALLSAVVPRILLDRTTLRKVDRRIEELKRREIHATKMFRLQASVLHYELHAPLLEVLRMLGDSMHDRPRRVTVPVDMSSSSGSEPRIAAQPAPTHLEGTRIHVVISNRANAMNLREARRSIKLMVRHVEDLQNVDPFPSLRNPSVTTLISPKQLVDDIMDRGHCDVHNRSPEGVKRIPSDVKSALINLLSIMLEKLTPLFNLTSVSVMVEIDKYDARVVLWLKVDDGTHPPTIVLLRAMHSARQRGRTPTTPEVPETDNHAKLNAVALILYMHIQTLRAKWSIRTNRDQVTQFTVTIPFNQLTSAPEESPLP